MIPHSCMRGCDCSYLALGPDNENMFLAARCLHLHLPSAEQAWRQSLPDSAVSDLSGMGMAHCFATTEYAELCRDA